MTTRVGLERERETEVASRCEEVRARSFARRRFVSRPLGSLSVFSTYLAARERVRRAAPRRAAQYFETETRALFRDKIQQASTRRAARVAGSEPGIPQSGWSARSVGS